MLGLKTIDTGLFHWINFSWSNPLFDLLMPFLSGNRLFVPVFVLGCLGLILKGGVRGRLCIAMLLLMVVLGDTLVCKHLKEFFHRPRPCKELTDVILPPGVGCSDSGSLPSSHAANWFAATMVLSIYYRRSLRFMLPLAVLVGISRIYNGVHYPSDVLAGAVLGASYAGLGMWALEALWYNAGSRFFPLWWQRLPSLITFPNLNRGVATLGVSPNLTNNPDELEAIRSRQWLNLGLVLILLQLILQWIFLASGIIAVAEDEAYQWLWSKHLALSYYSKPPLIALTHFLGTGIWGDNAFGVHFFSPLIAAIIQLSLLRFFMQHVNARAGFWVAILCSAIPLMVLGNTLMTVDPLSVLFWMLAMLAGWRAAQEDSTIRDWLWVGWWSGLGFLSKYTALFQLASWALYFLLYPRARKQLGRVGPYAAMIVILACMTPVLAWNYQHAWITVQHVAEDGKLVPGSAFGLANLWECFTRYTTDFVGIETLIMNPFIVLPSLWAAGVFWKRPGESPLRLYFFCMGAPVLITYFLLTFHTRVLPNWIVPSVLPLLCLSVIHWDARWQQGSRRVLGWLIPALCIGAIVQVLFHFPKLLEKMAGRELPMRYYPLRRISAWQETADVVEEARQRLLLEGKPVFIIGGHYGIASEVTFHLAEARQGLPDHPLVFFITSKIPQNQFYFWPGYEGRKGENAIYVQELDFVKVNHEEIPDQLRQEFESVHELGDTFVKYHGRPIRRIQLVECRGLR